MRIRPRLLVGSLLVAIIVIVAFAWAQRPADGPAADADLTDAQSVVTFPNNGLGNAAVAGERLPEATLLDIDGTDVTTADLVGQPMVLNIWYSTCPPCAAELPAFAEVDGETDDVRFVGVNPQDSPEVMQRFARERGVEYSLLRDEGYAFTDDLGISAFPVTLFITSDGVIVEQTGALDADTLRSKIADLLTADQAAT